MAFDKEIIQNKLFDWFSFFSSGGPDGGINETLNIEKGFKIDEIRIHFSSVFVSIVDFTIKLNSIKGSAHNTLLITQSMSGIQDYRAVFSEEMRFLSGDQLIFTLSMVSGVNVWGLNVIGWSIQGH